MAVGMEVPRPQPETVVQTCLMEEEEEEEKMQQGDASWPHGGIRKEG